MDRTVDAGFAGGEELWIIMLTALTVPCPAALPMFHAATVRAGHIRT